VGDDTTSEFSLNLALSVEFWVIILPCEADVRGVVREEFKIDILPISLHGSDWED